MDYAGFAFVFAASFLTSLCLAALSGRLALRIKAARHLVSVQATHVAPTLRLGGISVLVGYAALLAVLPETSGLPAVVAVSVLPVFIVGLLEDLHVPMSPLRRLMAVFVGSLVEIAMRGMWLARFDLGWLDGLAAGAFVGIPLTLLLVGGISHAFNLIDGLHGLASGMAILASCALGLIAGNAQDAELATICFLFAAVMAGFWVVNFPFGRLFLGDAGAYCVGFILAWLGISLLLRNPEVAAWAVFLVFAWPITETFWAILRRRIRGRAATEADRMHMHHVVLRGIEIRMIGRNRRSVSNPLATVFLMPFAALSMIVGVWFAQDRAASVTLSVLFVAVFIAAHILVVRVIARRRPARALQVREVAAE